MEPIKDPEKSVTSIETLSMDLGAAPEGLFPDLEDKKEPKIEPEKSSVEPEKKRGRPKKEVKEEDIDTEEEKQSSKVSVEEVEEAITKKGKETKEVDKQDFDDSEFISPLTDVLAERWGWEMSEEDKPTSIEGFAEFIEKTIEANSKPEYSDEIVERFDQYIRAGGDPRRFMQVHFEVPDYAKMDPKNVSQAKKIMGDYYKVKGLSDSKIEKLIAKAELDNELESEATEMQTELNELTTKQKEQIVARQEAEAAAAAEEQRKSISNVINQVKKTSDIFGIPMTAKDKEELIPYLFKRDKDGLTQQQRDYQEDPLGYLIATSFLYKNKDKLKQSISNKSTTDAAQKLREKQKELISRKRTQSDQGQVADEEEQLSWLGSFSKRIVKPT